MFTDTTTAAMFVAPNMQLFNVLTKTFLMKNGWTQIAAPLRVLFVSHTSSNIARGPKLELRSGITMIEGGRIYPRLVLFNHL